MTSNGLPHVKLNGGEIHGVISDNCRVFYGIPYAQPPVGPKRWKKAEPLAHDYSYEGLHCDRNAIRYCPQPTYRLFGRPYAAPQAGTSSEDCLQLDIWTPLGDPPAAGWPVYVWIHGGWLQIGSPHLSPFRLLARDHGNIEAVIVSVGYRLGVLGFLAAPGIDCNLGFGDQRCALEWVDANIHAFGGDAQNIALGGLSAGSYSTQIQLTYDFSVTDKSIIKSVVMQSNAIPAQPKPVEAALPQFLDLCQQFNVPEKLTNEERLDYLRRVSADDLVDKLFSLNVHMFRPVSDGFFVPNDLIARMEDGTFGRQFRDAKIRVIIGEVENEQSLYGQINSPTDKESFFPALLNYYPDVVARGLAASYKAPSPEMVDDPSTWQQQFGLIVSDAQVRASIRGFVECLVDSGVPINRIMRYRIALRLNSARTPPEYGVGHGDDAPIWWYHDELTDAETGLVRQWSKLLRKFLHNEDLQWGAERQEQYRLLDERGSRVVDDVSWDRLIGISRTLRAPGRLETHSPDDIDRLR